MTESITARDEAAPSGPGGASSALRIAVLDRDSGFIQVLSKRLDRLGWEHRVLASPVPADAVVSMRLSALVVDLAVLGPQAWEWLERLCGALPDLGIVKVADRAAVGDRSGPCQHPAGDQQRLDQSGLAASRRSDEHHIADPVRGARGRGRGLLRVGGPGPLAPRGAAGVR